ncbi:MAG: periplasmic heavy metal sensor [Desulfatitalea sp.]|nr:periplasmic heavy metal sensor [Desulfatitalea sp.]
MQTKRFHRALILGAVLLLMAGTTAAMAEPRGGGYGGYGMDNSDCPMLGQGSGHGMGPGMMGPGRNHGGNAPELTKEQQDKLDAAREKFWTENRKLRRDIEYKQDDLYDELTKDNADEAKVLALQKELSKLQGDFDQKAIQHKLEVRKIAPELFRGRGYGRGPGACGGYCWR